MKAHIYRIRNRINNHSYIGSTFQLKTRRNRHFYELKKESHHSIHLQNAYNKYGQENFIFEIMEELLDTTVEDTLLREQYYFDTLNPEYNICKTAGSCIGVKRSNQTKEKIIKIFFSKREKCFPLFEEKYSIEEISEILNYSYNCVLRSYKEYCLLNNIEFVKRPPGQKVLDTRDGKIYESIKEVSDVFEYNFGTLRRHLNDLVENRTPFRLIEGFDENEEPILKIYKTKSLRKPKKNAISKN